MKKVAFDTNVILDAICNRENGEIAQALIMEVAQERIDGVITANAITDIYYIARKYVGSDSAREAVKNLMTLFDIAAVDSDICGEAVYSRMEDFEDAVFAYACDAEGVDCIATRDKGLMESQHSPVAAYSPEAVMKRIQNDPVEKWGRESSTD